MIVNKKPDNIESSETTTAALLQRCDEELRAEFKRYLAILRQQSQTLELKDALQHEIQDTANKVIQQILEG